MNEERPEPNDRPAAGVQFAPTQWSIVLGARTDSPTRGPALEKLCSSYWLPIYAHLRRRGHAVADAEDLTQGFFAHLLEGDFLDRPDASKGRFRSYLLGALRQFLASHFERASAQKRGAGIQFLDWTKLQAEREFAAVDQRQQDPAQAFDYNWALVVFASAFRLLAEEQAVAGKSALFAELKGYLSTPPASGDYERSARQLGMSRSHVAVAVHRLNTRYRELILREIGATVQNPEEVEAEARHLLRVLEH
jgi:RNA polymerase sigma-70 factor (ECF subfamily)